LAQQNVDSKIVYLTHVNCLKSKCFTLNVCESTRIYFIYVMFFLVVILHLWNLCE